MGKCKFEAFEAFETFTYLKCRHVARHEQLCGRHQCMHMVELDLLVPSATRLLDAASSVADRENISPDLAVGNLQVSRASTLAQPQP